MHGNPGRAIGDVAIRLGAPVVTTGIGALIGVAGSDKGSDGQVVGLLIGSVLGFATGIVGAMALDASVLAYEDGPRAEKKAAPKSATITPSFGPTKSGFAAGLSGTF